MLKCCAIISLLKANLQFIYLCEKDDVREKREQVSDCLKSDGDRVIWEDENLFM